MPPANVTVEVKFTTTPPANSTKLNTIEFSPGEMTPQFSSDALNYTIEVPHLYAENNFHLAAVPENPNAYISITKGTGVTDFFPAGPEALAPGKTLYKIKVELPDAAPPVDPTTYNLTVDYEPDLKLNSVKLTQTSNNASVARFISSFGSADVLWLNYGDITVTPNINAADDTSINVTVESGSVNVNDINGTSFTLAENNSAKLTVKLEKTIDEKTYSRSYTFNVGHAGADMALATSTNGDIMFVKDEWVYYEVHIFKTSDSLVFNAPAPSSIEADYLIVAGGGGAGGSRSNEDHCGGGGGAGGLLYQEFDEGGVAALSLLAGSISVTVGAGGAGGTAQTQGTNGGYSAIGTIKVRGGGGGGAGTDTNVTIANGLNGGSGGGGGAGGGWRAGLPGNANQNDAKDSEAAYVPALGNSGGSAWGTPVSTVNDALFGNGQIGGGGGATAPGGSPLDKDDSAQARTQNKGGAGWKPADGYPPGFGKHNSAWIEQVTGTAEFSHGGRGGGSTADITNNYGDGGAGADWTSGKTGTGAKGKPGGDGSDGIVVIRFPAKSDLNVTP
jgi:hypothetical protein